MKSRAVVRHFSERGLADDFLGNPQTLELIARVANDLPNTKAELFERAVDVLWVEPNDAKEATSLDKERALDAAGAAFAAILLTGNSAIVRKGSANVQAGELALKEVEAFDSGNVERAMASRLFGATGVDRFSYWHRRVGEFVAAKWLATRADTWSKRKRLLAMFHASGAVPTSLRGVHAWLAQDPQLALSVIAADPMGLIEYGDADALTETQGRALLTALTRLAAQNPRFRGWGPYRARGLIQDALLPEIRKAIVASETDFGLRLLLLQQLKGTPVAEQLRDDLLALARDTSSYYAARKAAVDCLVQLGGIEWPTLIEELRQQASADSTRLAVATMDEVGFAGLSDRQVVEIIMAHAGRTVCSLSRDDESRTFGHFFAIPRKLPDDRLDGVLDELSAYADAFLPRHADIEDNELIDLAYELILKRVGNASVDPKTLWRRLAPFTEQPRYSRDNRQSLADWLRAHDCVRQAIQRQVLLRKGSGKNITQRHWALSARSAGFAMSEDDVVAILGALNPADRMDLRWREVLQQIPHDGQRGQRARDAAKKFAGNNLELVEWIDRLREIPLHEKRRAEREQQQARKRLAQEEETRRAYREHVEDMRAGVFERLLNPARAYLDRHSDLDSDLPPHERVAQWLGEDLAADALAGFESYLLAKPPEPSASKIARGAAEGIYWNGQDIIVAALAERQRMGLGFADLSAERLIAGFLGLRSWNVRQEAIADLTAPLTTELRRRDKLRSARILQFGPHFAKRSQVIVGLSEFMQSHTEAGLAADLAAGWLLRYPNMSAEAELYLIDRLTSAGRFDDLRRIAQARSVLALDDERRRTWEAVQLLVDFDVARARLVGRVDPDLLWHLRARAGDRRHGDTEKFAYSVAQLRWIVETFRPLWPAYQHPLGGSSGDTNRWDASDYLWSVINQIGNHTSAEAVDAVTALLAAPADGYLDSLKIVQAEQRQKIADETLTAMSLNSIRAVLSEGPPRTAVDLQATMLDALDEAQARLTGDPLNWYRGFFDPDGTHKKEESCRDELLKLLTAIAPPGVEMRPESHVADEKRVDIECSVGRALMVPIEVKGQWHPDLWNAADSQLAALYSTDWRAERRGIYLVLWFGTNARLTSPPAGETKPTTISELQAALTASSKSARDGRVAVRVLDLTRPPP